MFASSNIFRFDHRWVVEGSMADAYRLVSDPRTYSRWFSLFKEIEVVSGEGRICTGAELRCRVRAALPYSVRWNVTLTEMRSDCLATLCRLELGPIRMSGTVLYHFRQVGNAVIIDNRQTLTCNRSFVTPVHAILRRIFAWNHAWAMRRGGAGLARMLRRASNGSGRLSLIGNAPAGLRLAA